MDFASTDLNISSQLLLCVEISLQTCGGQFANLKGSWVSGIQMKLEYSHPIFQVVFGLELGPTNQKKQLCS